VRDRDLMKADISLS